MKQNIIIVGGGIAGMLSAYMLSKTKKFNIQLIEQNNKLGGLLSCFDYGKYGKFDYGAHNILETGIAELDSLLRTLLPEDQWDVASAINGQKRALTGILFDDKLQKTSPFIDLRKRKNISELKDDFLNNFEKNKGIDYSSSYHYAKSLFGKKITKEAIVPIFKSLYRVHPKKMDYMAMYLTPLVRVGLFNEKIMKDLLPTKQLSSILSYPKQENLGADILGTREAYYPKNYGIHRVIDALEVKLKENGVDIKLNSKVTNIKLSKNNISEIEINNKKIKAVKHIFYSAGHFGLKNFLGLKPSKLNFQAPPKTVITNIIISKKLDVGNICYFYNYDKKYTTFRVDNYPNYCSNSKRAGGYPISIEMLLSNDDIKKIKSIEKLAIKELKEFGVLKKDTKIIFAKTEILDYGFPLLTKNNVDIMDETREEIDSLKIKNLTLLGVLSKKDLFFESDIKKDLYLKIKEFKNDN
ncbi:MAG: NAD(P)-binding protein [Arcobacteraceae bacterium]